MGAVSGRAPRLPTLAGYLALLRSGAIAIMLSTVLGGMVGWWWQAQTARPYSASAAVQLPAIPVYVDLTPAGTSPKPATIDTTAQLVHSSTVLRRVSSATGEPVRVVNDALSVSAYPLSRVLIVTFRAGTARQAATGAAEAVRATLDERADVLAGAQVQDARKLYRQLRKLRSEAAVRAPQYPAVSRRIDTRMDHLTQVLNARSAPGRVVLDATEAERVGVNPEVHITTGLVAGFSVAVGWAWWRRPERRVAS